MVCWEAKVPLGDIAMSAWGASFTLGNITRYVGKLKYHLQMLLCLHVGYSYTWKYNLVCKEAKVLLADITMSAGRLQLY